MLSIKCETGNSGTSNVLFWNQIQEKETVLLASHRGGSSQ